MLVTILRLYWTLTTSLPADHIDELAHAWCENRVYALVEPDLVSTDAEPDPTTPAGEAWCELLCRNEPFLAPPTGVTDLYTRP